MKDGLMDLHVHSTFSDGTKTPEELVDMAVQSGIKLLGITDHDTVEGVKNYLHSDVRNKEVFVVPGIEIDTILCGREVHLLGYFSPKNLERIEQRIEEIKKYRMMEMITILRLLNQNGVKVKASEIKNTYGGLNMNSLSKFIVDHGYASNRKEAYEKYLGKDRCAYVEKHVWKFNEAIRNIHECGGIAVVAHPIQSVSIDELDEYAKSFVAIGVDGIEVYHPDQDFLYSKKCEEIVNRYKLFSTAGSDYHGDYKPTVELGKIRGKEIPTVNFLGKRFDYMVLEGKGCDILGK